MGSYLKKVTSENLCGKFAKSHEIDISRHGNVGVERAARKRPNLLPAC